MALSSVFASRFRAIRARPPCGAKPGTRSAEPRSCARSSRSLDSSAAAFCGLPGRPGHESVEQRDVQDVVENRIADAARSARRSRLRGTSESRGRTAPAGRRLAPKAGDPPRRSPFPRCAQSSVQRTHSRSRRRARPLPKPLAGRHGRYRAGAAFTANLRPRSRARLPHTVRTGSARTSARRHRP
jgi:hypothetical protein